MDLTRYNQLRSTADEYHKKALWEEKLRILQQMQDCDPQYQSDVLHDLGAVRRRLGQYDTALELLQQAAEGATGLKLASILGEQCVVLRHQNRFQEALQTCRRQYDIAKTIHSIDAEADMCRAIGNAGMCAYNISGDDNLAQAEIDLRERITRALDLQKIVSKWSAMAKSWETIGLDRLSLVLIAQGRPDEALAIAKHSQTRQSHVDPTVSAFSNFFYGNALWHTGRHDEAVKRWNAQFSGCTSPMAFCKEPTDEHNQYLTLMANAGVNFDPYDDQGYSALDYAVLSQSQHGAEAVKIITTAMRQSLSQYHIDSRLRQAEVRRSFRILFQETFRPLLQQRKPMSELRQAYQQFDQQHLTSFTCMRYPAFKAHGRLPRSSDGLATAADSDAFIVFFSYRWVGGSVPDQDNTQWRRMVAAVEAYIASTDLKAEEIAVWLDYACIDQDDLPAKLRGVDSLPIAVTLSNVMISLIDDLYYTRAWCGVEVLLIDALVDSYGVHHRLEFDNALRAVHNSRSLSTSQLRLTKEAEDRPKVEFLARQSKLIGVDAV